MVFRFISKRCVRVGVLRMKDVDVCEGEVQWVNWYFVRVYQKCYFVVSAEKII